MKRFNLEQYKYNNPYYGLFDVYFKDIEGTKESLLKTIGIAPSSYRKCRKGELNIGDKLIQQISLYFSFKVFTKELIDELQKLINDIYYDMYYKINDSYDFYINKIDELKKENYIFFPILDLLILFLHMNITLDSNIVRKNNAALYEKVKKYSKFYEYGLNDLYDIVCLFYDDDIPGNLWVKNYNNACAYHILASRSHRNKRYIESLFFGNKAKSYLNDDGNIKRALYINNIIMSSLIYVGNFEECYNLSFKQFLIIKSINLNDSFMIRSTRKFNVISMLALKKYDEIIDLYKNSLSMTVIEAMCVMSSYYVKAIDNNDFSEYTAFYQDIVNSNYSNEDVMLIEALNDYFLCKGKRTIDLSSIKNYELVEHLEKIIKNIDVR